MLISNDKVGKSNRYKFFLLYTSIILIFFRPINLYIGLEESNYIISTLLKSLLQLNYLSIILCWLILIMYKRLRFDVIVMIVFFSSSYFITYAIYPQNREFLSDLIFNLLYIVTAYAIIRSNLVSINDVSVWAIRVSVILGIWSMLIGLFYMNTISYMDLSDSLSIPCAFLFYSSFTKKNKFHLLLAICSLIFIVIFGSRGALLSIIILLLIIYKEYKLSIKKVIFTTTISTIFLINLFFYRNILNYLISLFEKVGISSRTLYKLLNLELFTSTSRNEITEYLIYILKDNWIKGIGMAGDRYYLRLAFKGNMATYAHNIFIEMTLNYGIILGGLLIIWLVYLMAKYYIFNKILSSNERFFISIFFTISFLQLLVSRSYLTEVNFFIFLALLINTKYKYNVELKNSSKGNTNNSSR